MDSFIRHLEVYRSISQFWVSVQTYKHTTVKLKISLWTTKFAIILNAILALTHTSRALWLSTMLFSFSLWAICFGKSQKIVFSHYYALYKERISYFKWSHQYIRYLEFRRCLTETEYHGDISHAIQFIDELEISEPRTSLLAHPFMSILIGAFLVILGGVIGKMDVMSIIYTMAVCLLLIYLFSMLHDTFRTKGSELKELKRFLLWANNEPPF